MIGKIIFAKEMSTSYANGNRYFYFMQLSVIHLHLWIINSNQASDASELFIFNLLKYICMNFQINSLTINYEKCENIAAPYVREHLVPKKRCLSQIGGVLPNFLLNFAL